MVSLNPIDWFSSSKRTERKLQVSQPSSFQRVIQQISSFLGNATFTGNSFLEHFEEGWKKNGLVFASIDYYKKTIGQATMVAKTEDGEILEDHWFTQVTSNPNPLMDERNFLDALIDHWWLAGNVFLGRVNERQTGFPMHLWPLMPHKMKIALDPEQWISHYAYQVEGEDQPLPREQVVHLRYQNPTDFSQGISPLRSAFSNVDTDNQMEEHVKSLLENHAIPGVILKLADRELIEDKEKRERQEERFQRKFGGRNKGKPGFLGKDDELVEVGMSLEELAMPDLTQVKESRILTVTGVSPILLDTTAGLERSVFKNKREARKSFWQEEAFDLEDRIAKAMTEQLIKPVEGEDTDIKAGWDNSDVPAVKDIKRDQKEEDRKDYKAGLVTRNEYRKKHDMEVVDDERGDKFVTEEENMKAETETEDDDEGQVVVTPRRRNGNGVSRNGNKNGSRI